MKPSILWFRDDLRVSDNPALRAATDDGAAVALYVFDEESPGIRPLGGASRWWLHHSLLALREDLDALGVPLLLRRGPAAEIVQETATAMGSGSLYWNRRYGEAERMLDAGIKTWAGESGMHAESFQASLLHEPWAVTTKQGGPSLASGGAGCLQHPRALSPPPLATTFAPGTDRRFPAQGEFRRRAFPNVVGC